MENITIKTVNSELEILRNTLGYAQDSPWDMYLELQWSDVIEVYNEKGFDVAIELIRRADIRAYREDEATCGNI